MNDVIKTIWMVNHGDNGSMIEEVDWKVEGLGIKNGEIVDARETTGEESIILPKEPVY